MLGNESLELGCELCCKDVLRAYALRMKFCMYVKSCMVAMRDFVVMWDKLKEQKYSL
jgi:hypothetical protein